MHIPGKGPIECIEGLHGDERTQWHTSPFPVGDIQQGPFFRNALHRQLVLVQYDTVCCNASGSPSPSPSCGLMTKTDMFIVRQPDLYVTLAHRWF